MLGVDALVVGGVLYNHPQHEILLARHQVTFHHFGHFLHRLLESLQVFLLLAVEGDLDKNRARAATGGGVQEHHAAINYAAVLKIAHAAKTGGFRQADQPGKLNITQAAILLQMGENRTINVIQVTQSHNPP